MWTSKAIFVRSFGAPEDLMGLGAALFLAKQNAKFGSETICAPYRPLSCFQVPTFFRSFSSLLVSDLFTLEVALADWRKAL